VNEVTGNVVGNRSGFSLSIVVPAYNEEEVLKECHQRIADVTANIDGNAELIFVNDGSTDGTLEILQQLKSTDPRIAIVDLSRNFGKEIAMTAGMDHARGDAVVVIDADLQDPPELIPEMIRHWQDGYDVVYAKRTSRAGESALKKVTAYLYYRTIGKLSRVKIPADAGDFRLLSRHRKRSRMSVMPATTVKPSGIFAACGVLLSKALRHLASCP
jgi:glycosyltransferase involved in cell wall biosynthesis